MEEEDITRNWGSKASNYYGQDEADIDDEVHQQEAWLLQKKRLNYLEPGNFGLIGLASLDKEDAAISSPCLSKKKENENSDKRDKKREERKSRKKNKSEIIEDMDVEEVTIEASDAQAKKEEAKRKDSSSDEEINVKTLEEGEALTKKQKLSLLRKEHPELLNLIKDLEDVTNSLQKMQPLLIRMNLLTEEGRKWVQLQVKLRQEYIMNICFYLRLQAKGGFQNEHPVIGRILKIRTLLKKYAKLDATMEAEMEKVRSIPMAKLNNDETHTEEEDDSSMSGSRSGNNKKAARKYGRGHDDEHDYFDPDTGDDDFDEDDDDDFDDDDDDDFDPMDMYDLMGPHRRPGMPSLIPIIRSAETPQIAGRGDYNSPPIPLNIRNSRDMFALPKRSIKVQDKMEDPSLMPFMPNKQQASEILNEAQRQQKRKDRPEPSADVQVNFRERKKVRPEEPDADAFLQESNDNATSSKDVGDAPILSKKQQKEQKRLEERIKNLPEPEKEVEGKRKATKHILNNRGLVRSRKKTAGNARVTNRHKYEKATKRRKGQVLDVREGAADGATYEGEATGVRTTLKKSKTLT